MSDTCLNLSVIPQFSGTCWFNAILMIAFYSQYVRKIMIKVSKKWNKSNSYLMILKAILLKYYNQPDKVQEFFNKIRPEILLFKIIKETGDNSMIEFWKQKNKNKKDFNSFGWSIGEYINNFFKYLKVNTLDITYLNGKYYVNSENEYTIKIINNKPIKDFKNKDIYINESKTAKRLIEIEKETNKILNDIPDIIILKHDKLFNKIMPLTHLKYFEKNPNDKNFKIKGLDTYDDIITLNGHKYKLDAVTLNNYDTDKEKHAIVGITCNDNRYVYNGWTSFTDDPAMVNKDKNKNVYPCSLMKYNWDLKKDESFCLNQKTCKLDFLYAYLKLDLCFSFGRGERCLVYVRITDENIKKGNNSIPSKIKLSGVSDVIRDIHDIKNLTDNQLKKELKITNNNHTRKELEKLYYEKMKRKYNFNSTIVIKTPNLIKDKPLQNLTTKTKDNLKKTITKDELIKMIKQKNPKLKGLAKLKKAELEKIIKNGYS